MSDFRPCSNCKDGWMFMTKPGKTFVGYVVRCQCWRDYIAFRDSPPVATGERSYDEDNG